MEKGAQQHAVNGTLPLDLVSALDTPTSGSIVIDSARGRGTRVTVTFPRAMTEALLEAV